jgi:hypothetical protein
MVGELKEGERVFDEHRSLVFKEASGSALLRP